MDSAEPNLPPSPPDLKLYSTNFSRGRPAIVEAIWMLVQALFVTSWIPGSGHRRFLLRMFGADIGDRVVIKPGVKIKFPWRLHVAANSWIGEDVWIDNLATVKIGANAVISQGAYLCTGSHDWTSPGFDLITKPIEIGAGAWVAARSTIGPGVTIAEGAVLGLGSATSNDLEAWTIYSGVPAKKLKARTISPK